VAPAGVVGEALGEAEVERVQAIAIGGGVMVRLSFGKDPLG
jgi:hypothetical protein